MKHAVSYNIHVHFLKYNTYTYLHHKPFSGDQINVFTDNKCSWFPLSITFIIAGCPK